MRYLLFIFVIALASCGNSTNDQPIDSSAVDSTPVSVADTTHPRSVVLDTIDPVSERKVMPFAGTDVAAALKSLPEGWEVLDTMSGDLNRDQYADLLVVLKRPYEDTSYDELDRPLLIFTGSSKGLELAARNDNVVLCQDCGGVWGDPYDGLAIKNGYFSVEHYGGSSWRWTKIITFKYNEAQKTWLLHRDAGVSYHTSDPEGAETETAEHQEDYGKLKFTDYNY